MYRLSIIVNEVFQKYLPMAEKAGVRLDLDFRDPKAEAGEIEAIRADLEKNLKNAVERNEKLKGQVTLTVDKEKIQIKDSGTVLLKVACGLLSKGRVEVKSRVGFGTTVTIHYRNQEAKQETKKISASRKGSE